MVAGVPAKHLRFRFEQNIIESLQRIRWWDWSPEQLKERIEDFRTIEGFCEKYD